MAEQRISTPLKRALSNAHVATVDDIAYEAHDIVTSAGSYYGIKTSLRDKITTIDELVTSSTSLIKVINTQIEELLESVEDLKTNGGDVSSSELENISQLIQTLNSELLLLSLKHDQDLSGAEGYATLAKIAADNAAIIRDGMTSTLIETKDSLTTLANNTKEYVSEVADDVKVIKEVADTLALSFDAQALFLVVSEETYQALTKDENIIYFIYDV